MPAQLPEQTARSRFEELWRAHYRDVFGYALRRLGDEAAAGDVAAETFTVAWRRFDFAADPSRAWLLAIAHKLLANHRRAELRRRALWPAFATSGQPPTRATSPSPTSSSPLLSTRCRAATARSSALVTWQELAPAEAAEVLGIAPARFSVRLHRAKGRLRKALERSGHPIVNASRPASSGEPPEISLEGP